MKKIVVGIAAVLIAGFGVLFFTSDAACTAESCDTKAASTQKLSVAEQAVADVKANKDVVVMDVRTLEEWNDGHAAGAEHFELARLEAGELPDVTKDTPIYVYCRSGNRSAQAKGILEQAGYTDIRDLGPFTDWQAAGGVTES